MSSGLLNKCFDGVAVKRLSAVEADPARSNQHEFNGVGALKRILGDAEPRTFPATFVWLGEEQEGMTDEGFLTWYDARREHSIRSEYRLYFPTTSVSSLASEHDSVFIASRIDGSVMVIITPAHSTMEQQVAWLFGVDNQLEMRFTVREITGDTAPASEFAMRYILEELGLELEEPEADHFDLLLDRFGRNFPTTRVFSLFARESLPDVNPMDDPDLALMAWMEREETLFRRLERHIVEERLENGFIADGEADVDGFLKFSLSVQNRRKSRVGLAFENHLEAVFMPHDIRYTRGGMTENRAKPDFIFPSIEAYHNTVFLSENLSMLGVKSTCKDRWRQVLSEAERIENKHLITLEPGISEHQTAEMKDMNLQLVIPSPLQATYRPDQQLWLYSLNDFMELVKERQPEIT